jgi:SAM-dependent methyltransferase
MPELPPEYYRDYDFINREKDYSAEVDTVLKAALLLGQDRPETLLEVGCGTGNHSALFAERSLSVTAVDTDPEMIRVMQSKNIPGVTVVEGTVDGVAQRGFDVACAMFNVINYVSDEPLLLGLFREVHERLSDHGVFVFDCWNGDAVRADPPASFEREIDVSDSDAVRFAADGELENSGEFAKVSYLVEGVRGGEPTSYSYALRSKLWAVSSLSRFLEQAGFSRVTVMRWTEPGSEASPDDWKVMIASAQ